MCDWLQMESNVFSDLEMEFFGGVCEKLNKRLLGFTEKLGNASCEFVFARTTFEIQEL